MTDRDPMAGAATNEPIVGEPPPDTPPPDTPPPGPQPATNGTEPSRLPADLEVPMNVTDAIRRVIYELPPIGKMTGDQHRARSGQESSDRDGKINYPYRSIEQVTGEAQDLCGLYGVLFVPRKVRVVNEREFTMGQSSTRWTDTTLSVRYRIYGPGGKAASDYIDAGPFIALGRDNSDKGFNKAMTQAFKQLLLQLFIIADPKDEGEHERHEQTGFDERRRGPLVSEEMIEELRRKMNELTGSRRAALRLNLDSAGIPPLENGLDNIEFARATQITYDLKLEQHREENPPPTEGAADAALGLDDRPEEARQVDDSFHRLGEAIEALPLNERLHARSHLIGKFGVPVEQIDPEKVEEALAIVECWPPPPSTEAVEATGQVEPVEPVDPQPPQGSQEPGDPAPVEPGEKGEPQSPQPSQGSQPEPEPDAEIPEVPEEIRAAALAKVRNMKIPQLKTELGRRSLPMVGTKDLLGARLAVALMKEWKASHAEDAVEADTPAG